MFTPLSDRFLPTTQAALRIAAGTAYFTHGPQKLLGWFGGGDPVALMSLYGAAGVIETVAGLLIIFGFSTRFFAFVASGQMAVAYLWIHVMGNGGVFWWQNRGELPLLYCFIFLVLAAWGAGPFSVDAAMAARRTRPSAGAR